MLIRKSIIKKDILAFHNKLGEMISKDVPRALLALDLQIKHL